MPHCVLSPASARIVQPFLKIRKYICGHEDAILLIFREPFLPHELGHPAEHTPAVRQKFPQLIASIIGPLDVLIFNDTVTRCTMLSLYICKA
jgi:hypothetical protein